VSLRDETRSPPPAPRPHRGRPVTTWPPERKEQLQRLCEQSLSLVEIQQRMSLSRGQVSGAICRLGLNPTWAAARERRSRLAGRVAALSAALERPPEDVTPKEPAAPPPICCEQQIEVGSTPLPTAARDVSPGGSWAFRDHPTLADTPPPTSDDAAIAAFIAEKGVTTTPPTFGPDQPAVEVLRRYGSDVVRSTGRGKGWLLNGATVNTTILWKFANAELKRRDLPRIKRVEP
jgi:hypothetical protein